jgi:hypothetical protein
VDAAPPSPPDAATAIAATPDAAPPHRVVAAEIRKPKPPAAATEIEIAEPRIVGDLSGAPLRAAARAAPLSECRMKSTATKIEAAFHIHHGAITLAAAAPDNTGDPDAANCVAHRIKELEPKWPADATGILFLVVTLPAR